MEMKPNKNFNLQILLQLFKSTLILSGSTFGGGFVIVSLMKDKFVKDLNWLDESEILDIIAIAQSSPGPIVVNASVILGYKMHGILGSLAAVIGTAIPPMVIISVISVFYTQFRENHYISTALLVMRAGVAAVIFDVVINLFKNVVATKNHLYIGLMFVSFVLSYFFEVSAIVIILLSIIIGLILVYRDLKILKNANVNE